MNNSYKGFRVFLSKKSQKFLAALPLEQKISMIDALDVLVTTSHVIDIKKLQGYKQLFRQRVGDYRIVFEPDAKRKIIYIHLIAHRKDIYGKVSRLK